MCNTNATILSFAGETNGTEPLSGRSGNLHQDGLEIWVTGVDKVVAIGLLTQRDLDVLGVGFRRAFPLNHDTDFEALLGAIDAADHHSKHQKEQRAS